MKLALLFSGQGSQSVGMGKEFYESNEQSKKIFDISGKAIKKLCFEGPKEELDLTQNTQPCMYVATMAAYYAFIERIDIQPYAVAGFSLGEYSALTAAGVFSFEQCLALVQKRAIWMSQEARGGMAAVLGADKATVNALIEKAEDTGILCGVNYNCPGQIVVAGEDGALNKFIELAQLEGLKSVKLAVSGAFHSPLMLLVKEKLAAELEKMALNQPTVKVVSNIDATYYTMQNMKANIAVQVASPVYWEDTIQRMIADGVDTMIEIDCGKTLCGFMKRIDKSIKVCHVEDMKSLQTTVDFLKGV